MSVRVGINGFGRIGRLAFRVAADWPEIDIVSINEPGGVEASAHLIEFDSVQGRWDREISVEGDDMIVNGKRIPVTTSTDPGEATWKDAAGEIDIMIESSGKFRTSETLQPYFDNGVRKGAGAAPVKKGALNIVMGINDDL